MFVLLKKWRTSGVIKPSRSSPKISFFVTSKYLLIKYFIIKTMTKLRILKVAFDTHIEPYQIEAFRGAMAHKVGLEHEWFHNHNNADGSVHFRYPLIQYKLDKQGEQLRPMLVCLNVGIEELQHYFAQSDWSLDISGTQHDMRVAKLDVNQYNLLEFSEMRSYQLYKWQPFNPHKYKTFQTLTGLAEKALFMENCLVAHILAFCRDVDWRLENRLEVRITSLSDPKPIRYKNFMADTYNIQFETNIFLPDKIGLGKGVAHGYGVVRRT
jgi:hypothetical protein